MGWLDNIEGKLDDALDDVKEEIGERLEQAGASLFGNGNAGLGGGEITLTVDGLPLEPYALTADSFLSQISEYRFYCAVAVGVEAGSFLDKPAQWSCTSADGLSRDYAGKVTCIDQGRILPDGQEEWVLTVSSGLAALRQQSRYRIIHRRTVIELAEELLQEYGLTVDNRTHEHYPAMDWTAQVGETDLQFLQRLLARDGIWFYSTLAEQGEVIVLADDQHGASRADRGELAVTAETGGSRSVAGHATVALRRSRRYYRWQPDRSRVHQQVCPSEAAALTRESQSSAGKVATQQTFFQSGSGDAHATLTQARLEQERQQCRSHTILVSGAVGDLQAGQWLPVAGHGPCLITRAALTFSSPRNHQGNSPNGFTWEAELLPLAQPFRPALPAQISLPLVFPARVEAGGPYSHVDGMASRKARIDFDDGDQPLTESSPPLRQLQPHGSLPGKDGQATGWDWPLRNGAEVLLTCLNNDPDKPLILGYAPAASQPGPVSNRNAPENRLITPAGHQLTLNDRKDAQTITLNTLDGHCLLTLNASSDSPIVSLACEQGALVLRAGGQQTIEVGKSSQTRIGSDSTTQVMKRSATQTDNGVLHHQSETHTRITAQNHATLDAKNNLELYSARDSNLRVQGSATITAKKGLAKQIGGNLHLQAAESIDICGDGSGDITLHQGGGGITIKTDGTIRLFGNTVTLKSQSGVTFNGNMEYGVPGAIRVDAPMPLLAKQPDIIEKLGPGSAQRETNIIPIYPLRYGVIPGEEGGYAYDHPNLSKGFPELTQTWYTLSTLRKEKGYIYIFDQTNPVKVLIYVYEGDAQASGFARGEILPNGTVQPVGDKKSYIAIPYEESPPDEVQMLYIDTPLSAKKLDEFRSDSGGLRSNVSQTVSLSAWYQSFKEGEPDEAPRVNDTLRIRDLNQQWASMRKPYTKPADAPNIDSLDSELRQAGNEDCYGLAVVLHDPVGIACELSDMQGAVMGSWQEYEASASRAMWASDAANMLAWQKRHDISKSLKHQTAPGIDPGFYSSAMRERINSQEENQWEDWKNELFRDHAREQFKEEYFKNKQEAQEEIELAAQQCVRWWQYSGKGDLQSALQTYDEKDRIGFLNLRCVTARCLSGMVQCEIGLDAIATELTPEGPEGVLARVTTGHPEVNAFLSVVGPGLKGLTELANQNLERLSQVIPADDASRALGATLVTTLLRREILSIKRLANSNYIQILHIMESVEINRLDVALSAAPALLLREAGVDAERAAHFALTKSNRNSRLSLYIATTGASPPHPPMAPRETHAQQAAWQNVRLGVGGLSLLLSTLNMKRVLTDLTDEDRSAFTKSMSAVSGLSATGSSVAQLQQFRLLKRADTGKLSSTAGDALRREAARFEIKAIGLGAISALMMASYELLSADEYYGKNKQLSMVASGVQFGAFLVGGAMYLDKKYGLKLLPARFLNVSGWVLLALEIAYILIVIYREKAKKEEWLRSSYWGTSPEFKDAKEEQHALYQTLLKPRVVTDINEWGIIANTFMPVLGGVLPDRTVRVFLPGYTPQISKVVINQGNFLGLGAEEIESKVVHENGSGYVDFSVNNLMGSTAVEYWPDYIGDPNLKMTVNEWFL